MQVSFTSNGAERGAWTEGMDELHPEQAELGVPMDWQPDERRDERVKRLLTYLADYVDRKGTPLRASATLRYGWTSLRLDPAGRRFRGSDLLVVQELTDPFGGDEPSFVDGVEFAIDLLAVQQEAIERCQIVGTVEHPHRDDTAVVCRRVSKVGGTALTISRQTLTNRQFHDSGWLVGCQDRTHDHEDPSQLGGVHLWRVVARYPWVYPYLAMPVGTRITLDDNRIVVFRPDERRGHFDAAPLFQPPRLRA